MPMIWTREFGGLRIYEDQSIRVDRTDLPYVAFDKGHEVVAVKLHHTPAPPQAGPVDFAEMVRPEQTRTSC